MARAIVVATFDTRNQAYEAAQDIDRLSDDVVDVMGGAIVEKDLLGNVRTLDSRNLSSPWGVVGGVTGGVLVGALIGALAGPAGVAAGAVAGSAVATGAATGGVVGGTIGMTADAAEWGLKEGYLDLVRGRIQPGRVALVAEVEEGSTEPVAAAVARHGGFIYRDPLS